MQKILVAALVISVLFNVMLISVSKSDSWSGTVITTEYKATGVFKNNHLHCGTILYRNGDVSKGLFHSGNLVAGYVETESRRFTIAGSTTLGMVALSGKGYFVGIFNNETHSNRGFGCTNDSCSLGTLANGIYLASYSCVPYSGEKIYPRW